MRPSSRGIDRSISGQAQPQSQETIEVNDMFADMQGAHHEEGVGGDDIEIVSVCRDGTYIGRRIARDDAGREIVSVCQDGTYIVRGNSPAPGDPSLDSEISSEDLVPGPFSRVEFDKKSGEIVSSEAIYATRDAVREMHDLQMRSFRHASIEREVDLSPDPPGLRTAALSPAPDGRGFVVQAKAGGPLPVPDAGARGRAMDALAAHTEWLEEAKLAIGKGREPDWGDPRRADLGGSKLAGLVLSAELWRRTTRMTGYIDLSVHDLTYARMGKAELDGAHLCGAQMRFADLAEARLSGAFLYLADLRDTDLSGADLANADLTDARLEGADIRGADLSGAKGLLLQCIEGALVDEATKLPEGWKLTPEGLKVEPQAEDATPEAKAMAERQLREVELLPEEIERGRDEIVSLRMMRR